MNRDGVSVDAVGRKENVKSEKVLTTRGHCQEPHMTTRGQGQYSPFKLKLDISRMLNRHTH